jgi:tetratricopeptide (TPR) repeat protein
VLSAEPRSAPRLAPREPAPAAVPAAVAARAPNAPLVHPKVEAGYAAYRSGDVAAARADYQEALADDAGNRDALLGLAALDVRAGRLDSAEAIYVRLLQTDPRDSQAQAALIALRGSRVSPQAAESRLKTLLAADPAAHVLNFTLGNQLAQQGRWAEAQQEYFKAVAAEPDNADFAYNLAVALDHMRQSKLALQYYQRAIALARQRGANFDLAMAESRAAQLAR